MKLYFCFPEKKVGGVSILFLRISKNLSEKFFKKTYLIDFEDGYMARSLSEKDKFIKYHPSKKIILGRDESSPNTIIFQSMTPWSIFKNIVSEDSRVIFWTCHPNNFVPDLHYLNFLGDGFKKFFLKVFLYTYYKKSKNFVKYLLKENSLFFMDQTTLKNTSYFLDISVENPEFLPIAIEKSSLENSLVPLEKLTLFWIGRLVDFKYFILEKLILDLERLVPNLSFSLKVIGDGPYLKNLNSLKSKVSYEISVEREIENNKLDDYLINNCSILFAMGTAALEGAKLGIPTILLDISYKRISQVYNYRWLFERDGMTLGENIKDVSLDSSNDDSLELRINEYLENFKEISSKTLKYFDNNHNLENTSSELLKKIDNSTSQWGKIKKSKFTSRGIVYNFYKYLKR